MVGRTAAAAVVAALVMSAGPAWAEDREAGVRVQIGGAGEWSRDETAGRFGPTLALEFTAIPNWLEIEAGLTSLFGSGTTDWSAELLFKKSFDLTDKIELEVGGGPEWKINSKSVAAEAVLELIYWPTPGRTFGWFVEPSYSYDFGSGHEQSFGLSFGVLVALP
jgi:hypothetical protein